MRIRKGTLVGIAAATAATVVATVSIGYVAGGAGVASDADRFDSGKLHALLLPADGHPAGEVIELTFAEATAEGLLGVPKGMTVEPDICVNYLAPALGDETESVNGWMQADPAFSAGRGLFVSWVAEVRGGAPVDEIVANAVECQSGEATVKGYGRGRVSNAEAEPLRLSEADTGAISQTMRFDVQDAATQTTLHLVAVGEVLIMTLASDPELAEKAVTYGYERAVEAGLG